MVAKRLLNSEQHPRGATVVGPRARIASRELDQDGVMRVLSASRDEVGLRRRVSSVQPGIQATIAIRPDSPNWGCNAKLWTPRSRPVNSTAVGSYDRFLLIAWNGACVTIVVVGQNIPRGNTLLLPTIMTDSCRSPRWGGCNFNPKSSLAAVSLAMARRY